MTLPYVTLNPNVSFASTRRRLTIAAWYGWSLPFSLGVAISAHSIFAALQGLQFGIVILPIFLVSAGIAAGASAYLAAMHRFIRTPPIDARVFRRGAPIWVLGFPTLLLIFSSVMMRGALLVAVISIGYERPSNLFVAYGLLLGFPTLCLLFSASHLVLSLWAISPCRSAERPS